MVGYASYSLRYKPISLIKSIRSRVCTVSKSSSRLDTLKYLERLMANSTQSTKICSTVKGLSHPTHIGGGGGALPFEQVRVGKMRVTYYAAGGLLARRDVANDTP
jgi:hypothetical protein